MVGCGKILNEDDRLRVWYFEPFAAALAGKLVVDAWGGMADPAMPGMDAMPGMAMPTPAPVDMMLTPPLSKSPAAEMITVVEVVVTTNS